MSNEQDRRRVNEIVNRKFRGQPEPEEEGEQQDPPEPPANAHINEIIRRVSGHWPEPREG